jgi:hypothetical protein
MKSMLKLLTFCSIAGLSIHTADATEIPITVLSPGGQPLCNSNAPMVPVPGHPNYFIGRILQGSLCGTNYYNPAPQAEVGIFLMNWKQHQMVLQNALFVSPFVVPAGPFAGISIRSSYDPTVALINGEVWAAWECTPTLWGYTRVSACVAPLKSDLSGIDATRLSIPVYGFNMVNDYNHNQSASIPQLIEFQGATYLYWTIDGNDPSTITHPPIITRGAELTVGSDGTLEVYGAGAPIETDDPTYAVTVRDIASDQLSNHLSTVRVVYPSGDGSGLYTISNVGGAGCSDPSVTTPGCWRTQINFTQSPLGYNVFQSNLQPTDNIPVNPTAYPRPMTDPTTGINYLFTKFFAATSWNVGYAPSVPACISCLVPFPALQ